MFLFSKESYSLFLQLKSEYPRQSFGFCETLISIRFASQPQTLAQEVDLECLWICLSIENQYKRRVIQHRKYIRAVENFYALQ